VKKKSLTRNAILNTIKTLMSMIFPLITYPYVTRILQVENIGKINFSASIVSYFTLFAGLGINTYAIREGSRLRQNKQKLERFAREVFTINILSTLIAYMLFLGTVASIKNLHLYIPLILIQSIGIVAPAIGIDWLYVIYEDYGYITIQSIIVQIISMFLMFSLIHKQSDYVLYAGILTFSSTAAYIFNFIHSRKYIKICLTRRPHIDEHIKPIIVIFAMSVATTIYVNSDTTMLGFISGDYYVGLYNASTKIYTVLKSLMAACILVSLPRLSNYMALKKYDSYSAAASNILNMFITLLLPIVVGTFMTAKEIVLILAGNSFMESVISLKILSISLFFSIIAVYLTNVILLPIKEEKQIMYATFVSAIVNFLLNFIFIYRWNHIGAAVTTVIAEVVVVVWQLVAYHKSRHNIKIQLNTHNLWVSLMGSVMIIVICYVVDCLKINIVEMIIAKVCLSIIGYASILILGHHTIVEYVKNFILESKK